MSSENTELWPSLLYRIDCDQCTPFLGAGAAASLLPMARDVALEWAEEYGYPYGDSSNLGAVAQFVADCFDYLLYPKCLMAARLSSAQRGGESKSDEPYETLAMLPLSVYVTTNYDDLMAQALVRSGRRPRVEVCEWNNRICEHQTSVFESDYEPSPDEPLVYHLHGHVDLPESLVLTDDDYLDFLHSAFSNRTLIPAVVQEALAGRSLLFIGYRLYDWNFRMLFRRFAAVGMQRVNFAVLRPPGLSEGIDSIRETRRREEEFRQQVNYFKRLGIRPYLGSAQQFAGELRRYRL